MNGDAHSPSVGVPTTIFGGRRVPHLGIVNADDTPRDDPARVRVASALDATRRSYRSLSPRARRERDRFARAITALEDALAVLDGAPEAVAR